MSKMVGDAFTFFANLSDQRVSHAIQMEALRKSANEVQGELSNIPLFRGNARRWIVGKGYRTYSRKVAPVRFDEMKLSATISILGGKGGFVNRWLNKGTKYIAGANIFTEDIGGLEDKYNKYLIELINQL